MNDSEQWKYGLAVVMEEYYVAVKNGDMNVEESNAYEEVEDFIRQQKTLAREEGRNEVDSLWRLAIGHLNSSAREKILLTKRLLEEARRPKEGGK